MNAPLTVNIHTGDNANHVSSNISISVMLQNVTLLYKVVKKIDFAIEFYLISIRSDTQETAVRSFSHFFTYKYNKL